MNITMNTRHILGKTIIKPYKKATLKKYIWFVPLYLCKFMI